MHTRTLTLHVSQSIGTVSAELLVPDEMSYLLTLAHGAGAGMNHSFIVGLSKALAAEGIGTLRFNFPYMEKKKKRPDVPSIAHATVEAALQKAHELFAHVPVIASGKSFGGRMSSQWLALQQHTFVKGVIFFGFPLHPAGKPAIERAAHLKEVRVPMLFLQGTRDELATWPLITEVCAGLPNTTLIALEQANHAFYIPKKDVLPVLASETARWLRQLN
ncbi:MAG TPA: dienelactone hydrolase family protein [Cyclobacteriaceae bacterium]|nr:dienelactone hydrolase family protein [Cyclobacteriaceae bacterium]HRJ82995.1 dienelactone hydrolase family protein [Cyclobacteriaceae bacterium]